MKATLFVLGFSFVLVSCTTSSGFGPKPSDELDAGIYGELDSGVESPWLNSNPVTPLPVKRNSSFVSQKKPVKKAKHQKN